MKALLLVVLVLLVPVSLEANTYYLSDGSHGDAPSDANTCTQAQNIATPKATFHGSGSNGVITCLQSGGGPHTLLIRGGTYDDNIRWTDFMGTFPSGTSWNSVTRIANYNASVAAGGCSPVAGLLRACGTAGELVWLRPQFSNADAFEVVYLQSNAHYIEFAGINMSGEDCHCPAINFGGNGPAQSYAHHIRVKDAELRGYNPSPLSGGAGVAAVGTHNVNPDGLSVTGGFELINLSVHNGGANWSYAPAPSGWYGLYIQGPFNLIEFCDIYDVGGTGLVVYNGAGDSADQNIIRANKIHNVRRGGLDPAYTGVSISGNDNQIYNNLVYDIVDHVGGGYAKPALTIYYGDRNLLYYNTVVVNDGIGIDLNCTGGSGCTGSVVRNNIAYQNGQGNYNPGAGTGTTATNNTTDGTNPNVVNLGTFDLHLSATSFTAIDTGVCLGTVPTDFDVVNRPQGPGCDRGAYEYFVAGSLPGIPTSLSPVSGATGVDLFTTLSFASTNATAYDFSISPYVGVSTASFQEFFTGADSTDIGASWTPYGIGFTNAQRVNGRARGTSTTIESVEKVTGTAFAANQWCRMRIITFGTGQVGAACFFRLNNDAQPSGLFIGAAKGYGSGYKSWAYRYTNGAFVFLGGESTTPWAANDFLEAHVVGQTLTLYRNGNDALALTLTATDPTGTYTSAGTVGLYVWSSTLGQAEIDNFEAGDIGPVFQGTFSTATYSLSGAIPNTTYYWIPAGRNGQGVTEGSISTFTTVTSVAPTTPVGVRLRFISP